jgi:hypothetical protein
LARAKVAPAAIATAVALCGCVTTQQRNARTVLLNERTLATETTVRVTYQNPLVRVEGIALIRSGADVGFAVRVANMSPRPLTDLPISVGVIGVGGRKLYLNGAANTGYYEAHVPSIAPRAQGVWVLAGGERTPVGGRPFALVGVAGEPPTTTVRALPQIAAVARVTIAGQLRVALTNPSGIPQYGLQVYAVASRSGRAVAVGRATVAQLDGGARASVSLGLVGSPAGAHVQVYALSTIFA